jgi:hypothetical protein
VLRKELKLATTNLLNTLENSGTYALLDRLKGVQETEITRADILDTYTNYIKMSHDFGETEHKLIEIMALGFLNNTKFWTTLLRKDKKSRGYHYKGFMLIKQTIDHLPKLVKLIELKSDRFSKYEEKEENNAPMSTLSLIVIEESQLSTPDRLILALQSVEGLYRACANFMGQPGNDLSVIACDSGSDKSFDFLGDAKIVDGVKKVILSFWDKVVYFRENKTGRSLELVAKSLPILEEVDLKRGAGRLQPEQAELIKRQLIDSVTKFATAGVTIPEIEGFTVYNPRQLLRPEQKLLVEPKQHETDS